MSNTELVGCPICKGAKKINGLGCIPQDCIKCNAVGWIEQPSKASEDEFLSSKVNIGDSMNQSIKEPIEKFRNTDALLIPEELVVAASKKSGRPKKSAEA